MNSLIEMYHEVFGKLKSISDQIHKIEHEITDLRSRRESEVNGPARIKKLEEQLVKIDEYLVTIKEFQVIAKRNLESMNVLTIATPPGYRVNLNRLRKWVSMIDKTSANDPYAQRVLAVAKCDEQFLEKKRKEFTELLAELRAKSSDVVGEKIDEIESKIHNLKLEIKFLLESQNIFRFAERVIKENELFQYAASPLQYKNGEDVWKEFAPGSYGMPMPLDSTYKDWFMDQFGKYYDVQDNLVLLPAVMPLNEEFMMTISCAPSMEKVADKGVQHVLLSLIDNSAVGQQKIYVIDGLRFDTSSLGALRKLEDSFALAKIPRNKEQITEALEKILFSFADIDDKLGNCDSVKLYNASVEMEEDKIPLTTLVVYGWPEAYDEYHKDLLMKIMTNYTRYGMSFIIVSYENEEETCDELQNFLPNYAKHNVINIRMNADGTTMCRQGDTTSKFAWYTLGEELANSYADSANEHVVEEKIIENEYVKYLPLDECNLCEKGNKKITLPIGVNTENELQELSFEGEGFGVYLTGAAGCGREQLLHSIITSVMRGYHPDDVELWLADFGMSEFKQYANLLAPHMKYVLLDDAPELVYDFLDRLTDKLKERRQFLTENTELERAVDSTSAYMPVIFVVIERFNRMVQLIAESSDYVQKLQELLENGKAAGMKFILSDRDFVEKCGELSLDVIQTRIAMKNSEAAINATLCLPSDTVLNRIKTWMGVIPKQYALVKYKDAGQVKVNRVNTLYFSGRGKNRYELQQKFIELLNEQIDVVDEYDADDAEVYADKNPVVVSGDKYEVFNKEFIEECLKKLSDNTEYNGDEVFVLPGTPRLAVKYKEFAIAPETKENILLVASADEVACATAVATSVMKCFEMQNRKVLVWGHERNKILKNASGSLWEGYEVVTDAEEIGNQIRQLREQLENETLEEGSLIVLLGLENLCDDLKNLTVEKEIVTVQEVISEEATEEEVTEEIEEAEVEEATEETEEAEVTEKIAEEVIEEDVIEETITEIVMEAYDAMADLAYLVAHAGKAGVHFMMCLNGCKQLNAFDLDVENFTHRLAFELLAEDSDKLFGVDTAASLPAHVCVYSNTLEQFAFRPYLHQGLTWGGWSVDENGKAVK